MTVNKYNARSLKKTALARFKELSHICFDKVSKPYKYFCTAGVRAENRIRDFPYKELPPQLRI